MTIEPTTGGSSTAGSPTAGSPTAATDPTASTNGSRDPATEHPVEPQTLAEAPSPQVPSNPPAGPSAKVTRAHAKTSDVAPRGRPNAQADAAGAAAKAAAAHLGTTSASAPATTAIVPAPDSAVALPIASGPDDRAIVRADRVEITQGGADRVEATTVTVNQGGIGSADARTIDVRQGGIGKASATDIAVCGGSIGFARGERVSLEMGAVGAAIGDEVRVTQSVSNLVAVRGDATVDQSLVGTLVSDRVTIRQPSAVLVLIARHVDGTVRPLLDWRGALAAGAVAGIVIGLFRMGRR